MLLQWRVLMENEKKQCERMSEREKFVYFLLLQYRSPYEWGKENPQGADCSGAVCLALMLATGCMVRTTADGLLKKFFTVKTPADTDMCAAFFTARSDRRHGDRLARKGEAVHVAGIVGAGAAFNAAYPAADIRTVESLKLEYGLQGCDTVVRGLDRGALQKAHEGRSDLFGLDAELERYFRGREPIVSGEGFPSPKTPSFPCTT